MICPKCGRESFTCIDSRPHDEMSRRRRYKCKDCDFRFTTMESIIPDRSAVKYDKNAISMLIEDNKRKKKFIENIEKIDSILAEMKGELND